MKSGRVRGLWVQEVQARHQAWCFEDGRQGPKTQDDDCGHGPRTTSVHRRDAGAGDGGDAEQLREPCRMEGGLYGARRRR